MKAKSIKRSLVWILLLLMSIMMLPAGAADEDFYEGEEIIEEFDNVGAGYISLKPPNWACASTFGLFSGTITVSNSASPGTPGYTENVFESYSGTFVTSGYNQVRFTGWIRSYFTLYDALYRTDRYHEYYVDFLTTF